MALSAVKNDPLTRDAVRDRLLAILGSANSFPASIHLPVEALLRLKGTAPEAVFAAGSRLGRTDAEAAFNFFVAAPAFLEEREEADLTLWVDAGLDLYDEHGEATARKFFASIDPRVMEEIDRRRGLKLKDISRVLGLYVEGLAGRPLALRAAPEPYTDGSAIFLPASLRVYPEPEENFLLYKVMATRMCGQLRYGSLDLRLDRVPKLLASVKRRYQRAITPGQAGLEAFLELFPEPRLAADIYGVVDGYRVDQRLRRDFPGLAKDLKQAGRLALKRRPRLEALSDAAAVLELLLKRLAGSKEQGGLTGRAAEALERCHILVRDFIGPDCEPGDVAGMTAELYAIAAPLDGTYEPLEPLAFQARLRPDLVSRVILDAETGLAEAVRDAARELAARDADPNAADTQDATLPFAHDRVGELEGLDYLGEEEQENLGGGGEYLIVERRLLDPPDELMAEVIEMLGDLGEIPPERLERALELGGRRFRARVPAAITEEQVDLDAADTAGAIFYDEWDYRMERYRRRWCALREQEGLAGDPDQVAEILRRRSGVVSLLRRQFEMFRAENRLLKRQKEGEEVDIDALVEALADIHAGVTPSEQLYTRTEKRERNLATAFLVDMSGSTAGWVMEQEKEALVLMCEALDQLKDRYGIFGFSGNTRARCDFYVIKGFNETYGETVKARIAGMDARDYTRMGPPIRHLTRIMERVEARTRLMVILSDGKPEDYDQYRGEHGIEDTRQALIEAKRKGIGSFCITIDDEAPDYISHMYGESHYLILNDIAQLPGRLPDIYRRLTT